MRSKLQPVVTIALAALLAACSKTNPLVEADSGAGGDPRGESQPASDASINPPAADGVDTTDAGVGSAGETGATPPAEDAGPDSTEDSFRDGGELDGCQRREGPSGDTHCQLALECGDSTVATQCHEFNGRWRCLCRGVGRTAELEVIGAGADACDHAARVCLRDDGSAFDNEFDCGEPSIDSGPGYCALNVECTRSEQLDADNSVAHSENRFVICEDDGDSWRCECENQGERPGFELPAGQAAPEVCFNVMELCDGEPIEGTGEAQCEQLFQFSEGDYCETEFECVEPVEIGNGMASLIGFRSAACERVSDIAWECSCDGTGTERFQLEGADGREICTTAAPRCTGAAPVEP